MQAGASVCNCLRFIGGYAGLTLRGEPKIRRFLRAISKLKEEAKKKRKEIKNGADCNITGIRKSRACAIACNRALMRALFTSIGGCAVLILRGEPEKRNSFVYTMLHPNGCGTVF